MDNQEQSDKATTSIDVTDLPTLQELERKYLNLVLSKTSGSKAQAAKILGVSIKTVYNKLDVYKAQDESGSQAT